MKQIKSEKIPFFKTERVKCILLYICAVVLILLLFLAVCAPRRYDLKVGSISRYTINATKDVVDEVTTEKNREAAANSIEATYHFQDGVTEEVMNTLEMIFNELRMVQQYGMTLDNENETASQMASHQYSDDEISYAQGMITTLNLSRYQITTLLRTSSEKFEDMVSTVTTAVENSLNTTIREGQVSQSISTIQQIVGYRVDVSLTQNILPTILRSCIKPNMVIEEQATEDARQKAREAIDPVIYLQGQNIIREGDKVSRSQLEMLSTLGLLTSNLVDYSMYGGASLIVITAMIMMVLIGYLLHPRKFFQIRDTFVVLIIVVLAVSFSVLIQKFFNIYLTPVAFGPMLAVSLLGPSYGIICMVPLTILLPILAAGGNSTYLYEVILLMLMSMGTGVISIRWLKNRPQRVNVILCGLMNAATNVLFFVSINWMTSAQNISLRGNLIYAASNGILSAILTVALQPVFESLFRLATATRLLEITNPDQPLLKRLMIEAAGTYHHSIIVANLAEAAAERIGGNPLLARAGAYYHDIGKLSRPLYFKENQVGENPHDHTDPLTSAQIVTRHPKDGVLLAEKYRIPTEVLSIIRSHHGDTPVMFFYHKALQMANGNAVDIKDFRYACPKPTSIEATVVMLADTVEAAVRSMPDPTPQGIRKFIERLIRGKLEDGQLSDSPITLRDIDEICDSFAEVLKGVFHERIEYPNMNIHGRNENNSAEENKEQVKNEGEENINEN